LNSLSAARAIADTGTVLMSAQQSLEDSRYEKPGAGTSKARRVGWTMRTVKGSTELEGVSQSA